jgi:hypothetical protein
VGIFRAVIYFTLACCKVYLSGGILPHPNQRLWVGSPAAILMKFDKMARVVVNGYQSALLF